MLRCIPANEFGRSASSTNEVSSGIMGLPQFFIRMETE